MTRFFDFGTTSCCVLMSSLLLLSGAAVQATGDHFNKNNNNNNEVDKHQERVFRQVRHSPFKVENSKELNRALAILEHESQNWHEHHDKNWWGWEEQEDFEGKSLRRHNDQEKGNQLGHHSKNNNDRSVVDTRSNQRNNKLGHHGHDKKDREFFFGRIELGKGVYHLERDFIFADGFKLILQGLGHEKKHTYGGDSYTGITYPATGTTYPAGAAVGNDYYSVGSATAMEKVLESGVVIYAAKNQRHFIFDDHAVLKASDITFVEGGCAKEGFFGGSMLFINRASGWFERVTFKENKAWVGGAIFAQDANHLDFHECKFIKNHADRRGGAVAIEEEQEEKKHGKGDKTAARNNNRNTRKTNNNKNNKNNYNRALYYEDGKENEDFVSTRDNNRKNQHHDKDRRVSRVHFFKCLFFHNSADLGGALFNAGSRTEVMKSHFTANHSRLGGAVFNSHMGRLLVRESSFHASKASAKGGAIFNAGRLWVVCSRFIGNQAPIGCDILNNGELKCTSSTLPVQVEGHGEGYCRACVQPAVAKPTPRSTPKRRVKKAEKGYHDKENGLFGGLFAGKDKGENEKDGYFYGYYGNGPSAYDRWNGYYTHEEGDKKGNTYYYGAAASSGNNWEDNDYYYYPGASAAQGGESYGSNSWSYDGNW